MKKEIHKIYYENNLSSIIESAFLDSDLSEKVANCDIFVDPEVVDYISTKLVIITDSDYSRDKLKKLINHHCEIIARVDSDWPKEVKVVPYNFRVNMGIVWNGSTLKHLEDLDEVLEEGVGIGERGVVFFPKIEDSPNLKTMDSKGNPTPLGWALHQVGQNQKSGEIGDLDVIKTLKMVPR